MSALQLFEKFDYPMLIVERHLDTFGHVNNATYLQIFEEARWEFITSRGFGLETIRKSGLGPVILECHLKFLSELTLRQHIIIQSRTISYEKKIGKLEQRIVDDNHHLYCEMQMIFGLFDLKKRSLVSPTPEWLHAVGMIESLENKT